MGFATLKTCHTASKSPLGGQTHNFVKQQKTPQKFHLMKPQHLISTFPPHKFNPRSFPSSPQCPQNDKTTTQLKFLHQSGKGGSVFNLEPVTKHQTGRSKDGGSKNKKSNKKKSLSTVFQQLQKLDQKENTAMEICNRSRLFFEAAPQKKSLNWTEIRKLIPSSAAGAPTSAESVCRNSRSNGGKITIHLCDVTTPTPRWWLRPPQQPPGFCLLPNC